MRCDGSSFNSKFGCGDALGEGTDESNMLPWVGVACMLKIWKGITTLDFPGSESPTFSSMRESMVSRILV